MVEKWWKRSRARYNNTIGDEMINNYNKYIDQSTDLVTTHEQTRAGFLSIALEKNMVSDPFVKNALVFKSMVKDVAKPEDLIKIKDVRPFLVTASGLSDKSLNYLSDDDQTMAIQELIDKFLKPAGNEFIDEAIFRYLIIKGDAVGGRMRNRIGALGEEKLLRCLISCMDVKGISFDWLPKDNGKTWIHNNNDAGIEKNIKAIHWFAAGKHRVFGLNLNIPIVKKNVDLCIFNSTIEAYSNGAIVKEPEKIIMLGELKGGIDPAGADEHWKTANTALTRIRNSFQNSGLDIKTSFVGAAIANAMAGEIFMQLEENILSNAANLTNRDQLVEYCNWILTL